MISVLIIQSINNFIMSIILVNVLMAGTLSMNGTTDLAMEITHVDVTPSMM